MNRFHSHFSILAAFFAVTLVIGGCKAPTVDYQVSQFATIRVMDFAWNCQAPMDVYWTLSGQSRSTQSNVYDLAYGQASVYTNLLQAGNYNVLVTPHLIPTSSDLQTAIALLPNQKYSLVITRPSQSGPFLSALIPDGVANPSQTLTYVRFMNLQPNVGPLSVRVDDPNTGDLINPIADSFGMVSPYFALQTALDTSYTFILTNSKNQVITRLGYQTFTGGNCYTLVYAGDPCETLAQNPLEDTTKSAGNDLRLRAFDDNALGNDQSYPITTSFRFNIVNNIVPIHYNGSNSYYDANYTNDTTLGFLVNGQGFPEFHGYTMPPIPVFQGGGENVGVPESGGALEVNYQSALIPIPLVIQAFATNAGGTYQQQAFTAGSSNFALNESQLVLPANNNKPWTLLFYDTVPTPPLQSWAELDTLAPTHFALIPVTDVSVDTAVTIVVIAGIITQPPVGKTPSSNYSNFWFQAQGIDTAAPGNSQGGLLSGHSSIFTIPLSTSSAVFTVTDSIGNKSGASGNRTFGNSQQVTLQAGGIYEIVSEGTKADPHLLIMHVNAHQ